MFHSSPINPISILPTAEMLQGFGVEITSGANIVDIGGGLSTLGAIAQENQASYASIDPLYKHNIFQITHALCGLINPILASYRHHPKRAIHLGAKMSELAEVFVMHPLVQPQIFGIETSSLAKRIALGEEHIERWFGDNKRQELITQKEMYFDFYLREAYGSSSRDLLSRKWIYQLLESRGIEFLRPTLLKALGEKASSLYEAWSSSESERQQTVTEIEGLRRVDLAYYTQIAELLESPRSRSWSEAAFIPHTVETAPEYILAQGDSIFCNFVLNNIGDEARKSLLQHVSGSMQQDASLYVTVPEESDMNALLMNSGGNVQEGIVYRKGGKREVGELGSVLKTLTV